MPKPTHIAETALYVDDLDRAEQFYTRLFDCGVLLRDVRLRVLRITDEQVLLLFLRGASAQFTPLAGGTVPAHDGAGPLHVCFGIRAEDFAAWEDKLAALNIPVESRLRWPAGATSLYFRDPDGHAVEFATPGLWTQT
jgi:catechol 2,3-dioxygenase-like lactoylglutathione lyase family enzyme